jgi:hypothetical protein
MPGNSEATRSFLLTARLAAAGHSSDRDAPAWRDDNLTPRDAEVVSAIRLDPLAEVST